MKKIGLLILVVLIVGGIWLGGFIWDAYLITPEVDAQKIEFTINSGESVQEIVQDLVKNNLIKGAQPFQIYLKWTKTGRDLQAGNFEIKKGLSYSALVKKLTQAQSKEKQITIPEGYNLKQIGDLLIKEFSQVNQEDWLKMTGSENPFRDQYTVLASLPIDQSLEGYLFPDTYRFRQDVDARTVVETMLSTLQRRLSEKGIVDFNSLMIDDLTFHQVLTLSSIVEKEVRTEKTMKNVADIFLKRLRIGMALQTDSTVNYITGGDTPSVSLQDIKIDSPYNTYQRVGLPPGPISNPGIKAINSVLNPTVNDWYYFLTSPEGQVYYAKTFEQHIINKNKYLR